MMESCRATAGEFLPQFCRSQECVSAQGGGSAPQCRLLSREMAVQCQPVCRETPRRACHKAARRDSRSSILTHMGVENGQSFCPTKGREIYLRDAKRTTGGHLSTVQTVAGSLGALSAWRRRQRLSRSQMILVDYGKFMGRRPELLSTCPRCVLFA